MSILICWVFRLKIGSVFSGYMTFRWNSVTVTHTEQRSGWGEKALCEEEVLLLPFPTVSLHRLGRTKEVFVFFFFCKQSEVC